MSIYNSPKWAKKFNLSIDKSSKRDYIINIKAQNEQKRGEKLLTSIEAERARNQFTKEEIAKKLGVSVKTYYNWINEITDVPSSYLLKMSVMFGKDINYLLEGAQGVSKKGV